MEVRKIAKKTITVIEPKQALLVDKAKYQQTRMAAYCRVSTDSAEQKTSYETQKQVYKRCTWAKKGVRKIVWRCMSRIEHGTQYCKNSPSLEESKLHQAIVRAINRFNQENETTYRLLMKASLSDALGIGGSNEEMELLTRRIDSLNKKMMALVSEAVAEGQSIDDNEGEFKEISDEIAQLNNRVSTIKELMTNDENAKNRLESINAKVEELKDGITEYDDTIVRQMIECIKVYDDNKIEVIFGGGTSIIEELK